MTALHALSAIFALYERRARTFVLACRKGCAACCTRSVTMTTLEGQLILEYLSGQRPDLLPRLATLPAGSPPPRTTPNQFAAACLRGEDIDQGPGEWDLSPCMFLEDGTCSIYPVRPFMCRSFGSRVRCDGQGEAEVDPLFLALNTVFMQCIEHLDRGRPWGNMNAILRRMAAGEADREQEACAAGLVAQPFPGFLLLPGEEAELAETLQTLLRLLDAEPLSGRQ